MTIQLATVLFAVAVFLVIPVAHDGQNTPARDPQGRVQTGRPTSIVRSAAGGCTISMTWRDLGESVTPLADRLDHDRADR